MNEELLSRVPLFAELPKSELTHLAETLRVIELPPDTVLFREGDRGAYFYIVIYGLIDVIKALGTEEERLIGTRGPGEFVGELSLVNPNRLRMASIRTRGPVQLWEMSHEEFAALLHRQPSLAYEMVNVLGIRLTEAHDHTIHDLQVKNRELQRAYDELKAAQAQIIVKERLERELQVAYEIQMSILPNTLPKLPGYNFGARMVPARAVGGDFYDVLCLGSDTVGVVVGDVTDKGVPSAIFMAQTHALLYAEAHRVDSPREVLERANRHLMAMSGSSLFVTVLYGILDRQTGSFRYARAGHELPIISTEDGKAYLAPWGQGQPLGLLTEPILDEQTVAIPPGGTLLLYTDGMFDDRNPTGEFFGLERLQVALAELAREPAQETCDQLLGILMDFQGDAPQEDDVTLVAVHSEGE